MCEFPVSRGVFCCLNQWLPSKNLRSDSWFQYNHPLQKQQTYYTSCHMGMQMGSLCTWHIESSLHQCNPCVAVPSRYFVKCHRFQVHWKYDGDIHHWIFLVFIPCPSSIVMKCIPSDTCISDLIYHEGTEGQGNAQHHELVVVTRSLIWF